MPKHVCKSCRWRRRKAKHLWCAVRCKEPRHEWIADTCSLWSPPEDDRDEMRALIMRGESSLATIQESALGSMGTTREKNLRARAVLREAKGDDDA